jgi:hypothetical protein
VRRLAPTLIVLASALVLASCTFVPSDTAPSPVPSHQVPFGLLSKTLPKTSKLHLSYTTRTVWFINGNQLLEGRSRPVPINDAGAVTLSALIAGPTDHESALGFSSDVPATFSVIGVGIYQGVIIVRLFGPSGTTSVPATELESGQLVLTAAGASNALVEVLVNSSPLRLRTSEGVVTLQARPSDYELLMSR